MINSLSGSMGSLKTSNGSGKPCNINNNNNNNNNTNNNNNNSGHVLVMPTSPTESSVSESNKRSTTQSIISDQMEQSSLTPPSLNFPSVKFELDSDDVEVESPDSSMWETFFSEHFDSSDFMVLSPVRNLSSPQHLLPQQQQHGGTGSAYSNYVDAMQSGYFSPPREFSPLGPFGSSNKMKGQSPLHKVFNSPNNNDNNINNNQYSNMQFLESLSLPCVDDEFSQIREYHLSKLSLSTMSSTNTGNTLNNTNAQLFDIPPLDCYSLPTPGGSQLTQEAADHVYSLMGCVGSTASLCEQLEQEHHEDKIVGNQQQIPPPTPTSHVHQHQHQHHLNLNHNSLMVPLPIGSEQEQDSGLQLVHLLLACAEAVAKEDYMLARKYLHHLNRVVSPLGDSMQRVASCFTEALSARLAATLTTKPSTSTTSSSKPFKPFPPNSMEILKIYQIVYQACPYIKFAHFTANQAIFEAFEAEERVHVIDLDILQGYQWPAFMQALAARPGGAPFLRITGVGPSMEGVRETGRCLTELAHSLHVPFEFHPVAEELEDLEPHMFNRRVGEALAVNSVNKLHRVPYNRLGSLLAMIRDQAPNIVTLVEQEASHNGPYFLGRFLEALHYYSAIFDSLDATFPPDSSQRAKVEQYIFAPEIRNIVACEGPERIERHERLEKWRKTLEGKGFKGVPLSANAVTQSKILLALYSCDGYRLTEDKGCLLLGWQDRPILAASSWRC